MFGHDQPAIRESLMRIKHVVHPIGRQEGIQTAIGIADHQREVVEAVAVIVHVVADEQKCAVLRVGHKCVPLGLAVRGVSDDFKHIL